MTRFGLIVATVVFVLDQVSKLIILSVFDTRPWPIEVLPFFNLVLVYNRGVSFGMLSNDWAWGPYVLAVLAVVVAIGIWYFMLRRASDRFMALACGLVIGGAFSNALDRLLYGAVVDFLDFHAFTYHWPAFNVADCAIVVGAILLVYDGLFRPAKPLT